MFCYNDIMLKTMANYRVLHFWQCMFLDKSIQEQSWKDVTIT